MHRPQKNSKFKSFRLRCTGHPTRAQETQLKIKVFWLLLCVFPLIPVGEVNIIFYDIDMVFYEKIHHL